MNEQRRRGGFGGCLRAGCIGCLVLLGLVVLIGGAVAVLAIVLEPATHETATPSLVADLAPRESTPGSASSDTGGAELPERLGPPAGEGGRVVLDVSEAMFEVAPGAPGEPIRVDGEYDAGVYELDGRLEQGDAGGWTYRLTFRRKVSWIRLLRAGDAERQNRLRLTLPPDAPFALEGAVRRGESRLELGGLALTAVDLELVQGNHALRFGEPLPAPLERFAVRASQGNFEFRELGNASPTLAELRGSMGNCNLDLRGNWRNDSDLSARWRMGNLVVAVPRTARIDYRELDVFLGSTEASAARALPPAEPGAPELRLSLTGAFGQIVVTP